MSQCTNRHSSNPIRFRFVDVICGGFPCQPFSNGVFEVVRSPKILAGDDESHTPLQNRDTSLPKISAQAIAKQQPILDERVTQRTTVVYLELIAGRTIRSLVGCCIPLRGKPTLWPHRCKVAKLPSLLLLAFGGMRELQPLNSGS